MLLDDVKSVICGTNLAISRHVLLIICRKEDYMLRIWLYKL